MRKPSSTRPARVVDLTGRLNGRPVYRHQVRLPVAADYRYFIASQSAFLDRWLGITLTGRSRGLAR